MLKYIKHFIEQSWLLIVSSFVFGLLLAAANAAWMPKIQQNKIDKLNRLMSGLLSGAEEYNLVVPQLDVNLPKGKKAKSDVYEALSADGKCIGWAFVAEGSGFADKIELVIAVDDNFEKLAGFDVLSSNETPGFGDQIKLDYYRNQFKSAPAMKLELLKTGDTQKVDSEIIAITGATVSSQAVVDILNNNVEQIRNQLLAKGLIGNGK
jgi:electron transport complex protein RnfG